MRLTVEGFAEDTLVRGALETLAAAAGVEPRWRARIEKKIPAAAGLGGGSSDAATALRLANEALAEPLPPAELHALAATLGADVPFFLADGPQLGSGDGTELAPLDLPQDFWILLVLPHDAVKPSTASVYAAFDERRRRRRLRRAAGRAPRRRSSASAARAISPHCPETTSPPRRSPPICTRSAPSGPTSREPVRRSTGCSTTSPTRRPRRRRCAAAGAPGSAYQRGTVEPC